MTKQLKNWIKVPFSNRKLAVLVFTVLCTAVVSGFAQGETAFSIDNSPLPASTGFVNDFANVIDPSTKDSLEKKLAAFKKTSNPSVEIAVVTVQTTGDRPIFDYSLGNRF